MSHDSPERPPSSPGLDDLLARRLVGRRLFLGGLSSAALASVALAACGPASSAPTGAAPTTAPAQPTAAAAKPAATTAPAPAAPAAGSGKTLNLICSSDYQPLVQSFADQFKQQTGTTVNLTAQAYNQTHDKIVSGLASGAAGYDIVVVDVVWTAEFAQAGFIAPLDEQIPAARQQDLVPAALVSRSYNGKIYQWPLFTMKNLYYNERMLKAAGFEKPPATWEELTAQSKAIMQKGLAKYGIVWAGAAAEGLICDYVLLMNAFGGKYKDDKNTWIINQGGGLDALQYLVDSIDKEKIADPASRTLDDRTNRNTFAAGDVAFIVNWTSAWKQFTDPASSQVAKDARLGLVPGVKAANVVSSTCTGGSGFGIAAKSANKDLAWQFIQTMVANEDAQKRWFREANQTPTLKKVYDDAELAKDNPQWKEMRQQMDYGFGRPEVPWYGEWTKVMQLELNRAIVGDKSPKQALDDAMKQVNQLQADFKA